MKNSHDTEDGPLAFPVLRSDPNTGRVNFSTLGMTLRDFFASSAMAALINQGDHDESAADRAYQIADAMLDARQQVKE